MIRTRYVKRCISVGEIDDFYLNYKDYVALNLLKGLSRDKN